MSSLSYSAIDVCGAQFNRLDCDGNVLSGPDDVLVTCGLIDVTVTPIKSDDVESTQTNGSGRTCARRIRKGKVTHREIKLTLCSAIDADLMELLNVNGRVVDPATGVAIGVKAKCEDDCSCCSAAATCTDPGVSLILWHTAWCGDSARSDFPCVAEVMPRIKWDPAVEISRSSEFSTWEITGTTEENAAWGNGPGGIYPEAGGLTCDWAEFLTKTTFPGGCNCGACGSGGYAAAGTALGN